MIGAIYQHQLNQLLNEVSSTWVDLKTTFDWLYTAAKDFAKETSTCNSSQTITTVSGQAAYNLNPDFLEILTRDENGDYIIEYNSTDWLSMESYSDYLQAGNSSGRPSSFAITHAAIPSRITGSATAIGTHAGGESVLTDSAATLFSTCFAGDDIINTTKSYHGVVLSVGTTLTTAMFDLSARGGSYASWASSDAYIIQPAPRFQLILDPPPDTSGISVVVPYLAKPLPVYSDYGVYPFATGYEEALVKYAAWLYKHRDSKPNYGDALFLSYERDMRKAKNVNRKAQGGGGLRVNFI